MLFQTVLIFSTLGIGIFTTVKMISVHEFNRILSVSWEVYTLFGSAILSDFSIAAVFCFYLFTARTGYQRTTSVINRVLVYTINTGLMTGIWDLAGVVVFATTEGTLLYLIFFMTFPKLYINSLFASLNGRSFLKNKDPTSTRSSETHSTTFEINRLPGTAACDTSGDAFPLELKSTSKIVAINVTTSTCTDNSSDDNLRRKVRYLTPICR